LGQRDDELTAKDDVEPPRELIEKHALEARNLDV
jgi:hypothetical protein